MIQLRTLAWDDLTKTGDWSSGRGWSFSGPHGRRSSVLFSSECRRGLEVTYLPYLPYRDKAQGSWLLAPTTCSACPLTARLWQSLTVGSFTAIGLDQTKFTPEAALCCDDSVLCASFHGTLDPTAPPKWKLTPLPTFSCLAGSPGNE